MDIEEINFEKNDSEPRLIYVVKVGNAEGMNIYRFMYSDDIENVWVEEWNEKPACNCRYLEPEPSMYSFVKEIKTEISLDLATEDCCHSYQDCMDNIVSIASENINYYEDYPEPFRLVFHYGETIDEVDKKFAQRNIVTKFVKKQ